MKSDSLLTFNEAKAYLRVNKATLHKLIREKELPAFRVGKQLRIDKGELAEWLQKHRLNNNNKTGIKHRSDNLEPASVSLVK